MRAIVTAAILATGGVAAATIYQASPEDYRRFLGLLRAGDTLLLSAGEYRNGLPLYNLSGTAAQPIVISGPERGATATFIARPGQNTVSIVDSRYVAIKNFVLEGNNLPVDAVKAERQSHYAHDITLDNLSIRGHGNNQQTVAISSKCPAWNWVIRRSTIIGAGTGMYLGDSDGSAPFVAGIIERNLIVDSIGYNLQIKHQLSRPALPGMPDGHSTTIIRDNVFAKPAAGSDEAARPNVLVGHFPLEGTGIEDDYAVYGNFFYQNRHEALFQGEGNVALYNNIFINSYGDAIRIQPHNALPRRITIAYNTVLAKGTGISVIQKEGAPQFSQRVGANMVFAGVPISGGDRSVFTSGNSEAMLDDAQSFLNRPFAPLGKLDLYPRRALSPAMARGAMPTMPFPDWEQDFNGRPRRPGSVGAYGGSGANPAWLPRLELKPDSGKR